MATISEILSIKGPHVLSIGSDASALDAALLMNEHKVGSLVVTDAGRVQGIITERDILQRLVAQRRDPARTKVADIMTTEVVCCTPATTIEEAKSVMKNRRIRHLPVIEDGRWLRGLISIGDLNAYETNAQELTIHFLHEYLYGQV